jgi:hypothetical protein
MGRRLRKWLGRKSEVRVVNMPLKPVLTTERLQEIFAVDKETPWLEAVLAVMAGREQILAEMAANETLTDFQRAFCCGGLREIMEAQEQIIDLMKAGNKAKRGGKGRG